MKYQKSFINLCFLGLLHLTLASDFYSFKVLNHDGEEISLDKFRGKVTLVVNVASQCGFTDATYRALTRLHDILSFDGYFSVLAFPCNQFGEQEPAEAKDIFLAMQNEYGIEFPIFDKIEIIGSSASPAFKNLIEQSSVVPDWNFYKYLVNESGKVLKGWGTRTTVEEIFDDIQAGIEVAKLKGKDSSQENKEELESQSKDEL